MSSGQALVAIVGLAFVTLLTRGFFMLPGREWPLPGWLQEGLRFAPLAALVAIVLPELLMPQGRLMLAWNDPRLLAAALATGWYFWRHSILETIVVGSLAALALRALLATFGLLGP
ncbi:MAG: AzlD domain-containing protein [Rubrivivax sp.]